MNPDKPTDAPEHTEPTEPKAASNSAVDQHASSENEARTGNGRGDASAADTTPQEDAYPEWAIDFARKYFTKTLTQFILYGNVRDFVPSLEADGTRRYSSLREFLSEDLFAARDIVVFYDRSAGIHFRDAESKRDFNRALSGYDSIFGTDYMQKLPKDPVRVFSVLENYFRVRLGDGRRIALVIDYAETVVPMAETATYSTEDRNALVFLQKWSHDPLFVRSDFTVCLVTENLSNLNQQLVQSPYTAEIHLPHPSESDRRTFLEWYLTDRRHVYDAHARVPLTTLAKNTAGLNLIQLRTILADVIENRTALTFEALSRLKKEMIEAEAYGMLEFVETSLHLDLVAGHTYAKEHLRAAAGALRKGRGDALPMGYLVSGPVGSGKTFLITCFAGEIGIPMVKLKNFRSQWQGVTEGNLEKILGLLEAMTPVAVMIDEADAALGDRDASGDSGVSQRVFAQIASFMSNPAHRGKVIFFLVTARPDLMPVDLKRQGRAEEHLALFYPETREEREELLQVMMRRTGIDLPVDEVPESLLNGDRTLSGADMEALMTRAKFRVAASDDERVSGQVLEEVVNDFIPPTYPQEVELQTLAAVLESTSKSLLPEKYRDLEREEVVRRVEELKRLI